MNSKKVFMKNIIKQCSDRCYQKPEISTSLKLFILNLISLLLYNKITSGEFFSSEDKDPRLRLRALGFNPRLRLRAIGFKCYTCYFKGSYSSKTVCFCGTTLRRKRLRYLSFPNNVNEWFHLSNMQPKSNLSHIPGDLNNMQVTDITDVHEDCIPLDVAYLTSPWKCVAS